MQPKDQGFSTRAIHAGQDADPATDRAGHERLVSFDLLADFPVFCLRCARRQCIHLLRPR